MRRLALPAAVLVLLAACTAAPDPGPDADEIEAWFSRQSGSSADDSLGSATSKADPADDDLEQPDDAGVTLTFSEPTGLTGVRLSCFGSTSLDFRVHVTTASASRTYGYDDVACGEDAEQALADTDVTDVRLEASGADHAGAWHAVVLGRAG